MREAVIVALGRSAVGKAPKGALKYTRPEDLACQVLEGVLKQVPQIDLKEVDDVILGCAFPEAEQGMNIAKIVAAKAGLPEEVSGQTVNRFCSSGLQAIATAANSIIAGQSDIMIAGGVESMSTIPMGGNTITPDVALMANTPKELTSMGLTAENIAIKYGITRLMQDEFAASSHAKAAKAQDEGKFAEEIIPVEAIRPVRDENGVMTSEKFIFSQDEGIRRGSSAEGLAKLRTVFKATGSVTAANSSQTSDGASMVVIMSKEKAEELGIKALAKFISFAAAGVPADYMGIGPIAAIPKALKIAKMNIEDIDIFELNEAFAAQALASIQELKIDINKVNPNGGAIALGHPLGCTGSFLTTKLIHELRRQNKKYGVVSMCIGGGMGAAGVFELL